MFEPRIQLEHADSRGEIYSIQLPDDRELMLLHSTPGSFRGGHSHDCDEVVMLLSGRMYYHKRLWTRPDAQAWQDVKPGESCRNYAEEIHMGEFLEDTWLIEMKLAKKGEWSQEDYEPYRKQVRESQ